MHCPLLPPNPAPRATDFCPTSNYERAVSLQWLHCTGKTNVTKCIPLVQGKCTLPDTLPVPLTCWQGECTMDRRHGVLKTMPTCGQIHSVCVCVYMCVCVCVSVCLCVCVCDVCVCVWCVCVCVCVCVDSSLPCQYAKLYFTVHRKNVFLYKVLPTFFV